MSVHDPEGITTGMGSRSSTAIVCFAIAIASAFAPALQAGCPQQVWSSGTTTSMPSRSSTRTTASAVSGEKWSTRHVTSNCTLVGRTAGDPEGDGHASGIMPRAGTGCRYGARRADGMSSIPTVLAFSAFGIAAFLSTMLPVTEAPAPFRWGILGVARINRALVGPLASNGHQLLAIASRSVERARTYAEAQGIARAYGSYEELLADPDIDAVYIPLPHSMHVEWAEKAAQAGKHVLVEKPISLDGAGVRTLHVGGAHARRDHHRGLHVPAPSAGRQGA